MLVGIWYAVVLLWLLGRLIGDRFLWSQYLEWIPTESVVLLGLATALATGLLRGRRNKRVRNALVVLGVTTAWLLLGEWRLWKAALPDPGPPEFRLTFMNISRGAPNADLSPLFEAGGDVVVLSNVHPNKITFEQIYGFPQADLLRRAVGITPGESPPGEVHTLRHGSFRVLSRWPIRRRASARVGPQESWIENDVQGGAGILMLELETPEGPLVVWAVDMPRVLGASRRDLFAEAAERVAGVTTVQRTDGLGRWVLAEPLPDEPLSTPDIVVGDFNTPGHAWSVSNFHPGLRPARADARLGPAGTWPAPYPLFEIDLARLGPGVEAVRTGRIRCEGCRHLGLSVGLRRTPTR